MRKRFLTLGFIVTGLALIFSAMLVRLQLVEKTLYAQKVDNLVSQENEIIPLRGRIFDSSEKALLAQNVSRYSIYVSPAEFPSQNRMEAARSVSAAFGVPVERVLSALRGNKTVKERSIVRGLTYEDFSNYLEIIGNYPGVRWSQETLRSYPYGPTMAHVIGYVGDISAAELQTLQYDNYSGSEVIGKSGVEKQYEEQLRGKKGISSEQVNVFGQSISDTQKIVEPSRPGYDLVLTLDKNIQELTEKALGDRIGAVVVMKPATGAVLAMVSYPRFNPNNLVAVTDQTVLTGIQNNASSPFLNRALQATAPPASTFKVLMTMAFLQEFPSDWNIIVRDTGSFVVGNRRFLNYQNRGNGDIGIMKAVEVSSNVFFYTLGVEKLGAQRIARYAALFGLGAKTGIDLPFEISGIVPSPQWKQQRLNQPWVAGDTANLSIGQGFLEVTPIQMAQLTSAVVNGGAMYKPHVLKAIKDQVTGETVRVFEPELSRKVDLDPKVFQKLRQAMRGVITNGTARLVVTTKAVQVAAKTGTGQIVGGDRRTWHSWFISYGPYEGKPEDQVVVVVWVDAANEWEWWAPKAANLIYEGIFAGTSYEETVKSLRTRGLWYW